MSRILDTLLRGYQLVFSPFWGGGCRFQPTCSDYAREAIARHGCIRGGYLTLHRLLRCHPLCKPGFDPVPPIN